MLFSLCPQAASRISKAPKWPENPWTFKQITMGCYVNNGILLTKKELLVCWYWMCVCVCGGNELERESEAECKNES